jgi:DNA-directed RNA polymerase subunit RPC12/RpoP
MIEMKYKKDQYINGFSICALIFAGMFFYWGINGFIDGFWRFRVDWINFLWIGIGSAILVSQIAAITNRSKLKNVVSHEFEHNPNISVEEISNNTGISVRDIRAIILDLKSSGRLKGQFSTQTGDAESMRVEKEEEHVIQEHSIFCPNCGTPIIKDEAVYCAYCGSKL